MEVLIESKQSSNRPPPVSWSRRTATLNGVRQALQGLVAMPAVDAINHGKMMPSSSRTTQPPARTGGICTLVILIAFSPLLGCPVRKSQGSVRDAIETQDRDLAWQAQAQLGAGLHSRHCASCHGASLEGQPNWKKHLPDGSLPAPPEDETGHSWHHPDPILFATVKFGGKATAPPDFPSNMPPFAGVLSDDEIRAVLVFIKSRWPVQIRQLQEEINQRYTSTHAP